MPGRRGSRPLGATIASARNDEPSPSLCQMRHASGRTGQTAPTVGPILAVSLDERCLVVAQVRPHYRIGLLPQCLQRLTVVLVGTKWPALHDSVDHDRAEATLAAIAGKLPDSTQNDIVNVPAEALINIGCAK